MNILLIDSDSKIPNLALMKVSSYYKSGGGHNVGFNVTDPDKVYCSIIFTKNRHKADGLRLFYPQAEIDIGGSGYDLNKSLPPEIDRCSPDYSIYPDNDRYIGFTTRGCIRNCPFCIVRRKEGYFYRLYDSPAEALDHIQGNGHYNKIELMDNNILADKEWFMALTEEIIKRNLEVDFNQGLDCRLLDRDIAKRLSELKPIGTWKFAFDNTNYESDVIRAIDLLNEARIHVRARVNFYVYCDGDHSYDDVVYRMRVLKEHGATPYIMVNPESKMTPRLRHLKKWSRPWIFWSIDIDEYGKVPRTDRMKAIT